VAALTAIRRTPLSRQRPLRSLGWWIALTSIPTLPAAWLDR